MFIATHSVNILPSSISFTCTVTTVYNLHSIVVTFQLLTFAAPICLSFLVVSRFFFSATMQQPSLAAHLWFWPLGHLLKRREFDNDEAIGRCIECMEPITVRKYRKLNVNHGRYYAHCPSNMHDNFVWLTPTIHASHPWPKCNCAPQENCTLIQREGNKTFTCWLPQDFGSCGYIRFVVHGDIVDHSDCVSCNFVSHGI